MTPQLLAWRTLALLILACLGGGARAQPAGLPHLSATAVTPAPAVATAAPKALRADFERVRQLALPDLFDRPLYLQSTETAERLQGDVYALVDHPYARLRQALVQAGPWCSILLLHLNMQYCRASGPVGHELLDAGLGRKFDQALAELYWLRFNLAVQRADDDYLQVLLQSASGPLGTHDYRIAVEALPWSEHQSLLHLRYGYSYGRAAGWAMQAYLATLGRGKLGFSKVGVGPDGQVIRVGGLRGVLERNTLRYQMAIEAYLGSQALPPEARLAQQLRDWFNATERYPQQLHEIDREAYVGMKQRQALRQLSQAPPPRPL